MGTDKYGFDPGPGWRFATRRELFIDNVMTYVDALVGIALSALAGAAVMAVAFGMSWLVKVDAFSAVFGEQPHPDGVTGSLAYVVAGVGVALSVAVSLLVNQHVMRRKALRGSIVRPVGDAMSD